MDLSKLPRLSETDKHSPQPQRPGEPESGAPVVHSYEPAPERQPEAFSRGPEVWISIAVGVILILLYPRIWQYALSRLFGTAFTWTFNDPQGNPLNYTESVFFWGDLGIALFALVLIVEGLAFAFSQRRGVLWAAFVLTLIATAYNLIYLVASYSQYGLPIVSALAVAFGIYIAMYQWKLLNLRWSA